MVEIQIRGLETFTEKEKEITNKVINEYIPKFQRTVKTPIKLKIDIKEYDKDGKVKKYSINSQIIFSGKIFVSSSWDWNLAKAIHKSMGKIESELEHWIKK
jgi:hypothetical protein